MLTPASDIMLYKNVADNVNFFFFFFFFQLNYHIAVLQFI
jgi:hypothetical protein